jgi:hypothetical protein
MKIISFLVIFSAFSAMAFSQENFQDVLFLKNGKIKRGIIYEQVPFGIIKICTEEGDSLEFQSDEVDRLIREPILKINKTFKDNLNQKGYQGILESGFSTPASKGSFAALLKLNLINGYRFNPHLFLGCGLGLSYSYKSKNAYWYSTRTSPVFNDFGVPVFINIRINPSSHKYTPFIGLSLGSSFDLNNNNPLTRKENYSLSQIRGVGLLLGLGAGINYRVSDTFGMNIGLGFESQRHKSYSTDCPKCQDNRFSSSNSLSIDIGLSFK